MPDHPWRHCRRSSESHGGADRALARHAPARRPVAPPTGLRTRKVTLSRRQRAVLTPHPLPSLRHRPPTRHAARPPTFAAHPRQAHVHLCHLRRRYRRRRCCHRCRRRRRQRCRRCCRHWTWPPAAACHASPTACWRQTPRRRAPPRSAQTKQSRTAPGQSGARALLAAALQQPPPGQRSRRQAQPGHRPLRRRQRQRR